MSCNSCCFGGERQFVLCQGTFLLSEVTVDRQDLGMCTNKVAGHPAEIVNEIVYCWEGRRWICSI